MIVKLCNFFRNWQNLEIQMVPDNLIRTHLKQLKEWHAISATILIFLLLVLWVVFISIRFSFLSYVSQISIGQRYGVF